MKNITLLLTIFIISLSCYSQQTIIIEENESLITFSEFNGKENSNTEYNKVMSVIISDPETYNFKGESFHSYRYIYVYKENKAIVFVEWKNENKSLLTSRYIKK